MAHYCTVRVETVTRWVREGSLAAHTTAGGRYRVPVDVAIQFMRDHNIPIPDQLLDSQEAKRVLAVDDEREVLENVVGMLAHYPTPLDVHTESDGIAACIAIGWFKPHLLILDLKMPRMDGFEVCERVRADPTTRDTRILVSTGFSDDQTRRRALEAGANDYLTKPYRMEDLLEKVENLIGAPYILAKR
jgi:CheY-like chemotaxis protein